ncbi:MAG: hypothetical protein AAGC92_15770 [Pseudomonadota bacterium]
MDALTVTVSLKEFDGLEFDGLNFDTAQRISDGDSGAIDTNAESNIGAADDDRETVGDTLAFPGRGDEINIPRFYIAWLYIPGLYIPGLYIPRFCILGVATLAETVF